MAQPTPANERNHAMDALRGVAVLGILLVNINSFGLPLGDAEVPFGLGYAGPLDAWVFAVVSVFAAGKFMSLFALLFGAGVAMFIDRRSARGASAAGLHYRRLATLGGLGVIHGLFIWYGDILLPYALCGALLYPLLLIPRRWFVVVVLSAWSIALCGTSLFGLLIYWVESTSMQGDGGTGVFDNEVELMRSGLAGVMKVRAVHWLIFLFLFPFLVMPWVLSLMLTGAWAVRSGWMSGKRSSIDYRRLLLVCLAVGLPIGCLRTALSFVAGRAVATGAWMPLNLIDASALAGAWLACVMLACRVDALARARAVFAAVGRMALTNYIAQSLICTALFYGYGLGWFGALSRSELLAVALCVCLLQLVWSPVWLARFERGPLEAVWRRLTYGRG
ncbi:MAG: DUF418 domain-containing protein [Phycisphaeraceae bacterium]